MARCSNRDRCHQVHRWLRSEYPTKKGTRLRVVARMPAEHGGNESDGVIVFEPASLPPLIYINASRSRSTMVYAVLHEYAHGLLVDRHPRDWDAVRHSDPFYRLLGILERRFFEANPTGERESRDA